MPHYEFFCPACERPFAKILKIADHEKTKIVCPKCGNENVEQRWAAFYAVTSQKSAA